MLNDVVRRAMARVHNRFNLAVLAAERSSQLLQGARPTVDNSKRERVMKVALREIADGHIEQDGDVWRVERPPSAFEQVFALPPREDGELSLSGEPAEAAPNEPDAFNP